MDVHPNRLVRLMDRLRLALPPVGTRLPTDGEIEGWLVKLLGPPIVDGQQALRASIANRLVQGSVRITEDRLVLYASCPRSSPSGFWDRVTEDKLRIERPDNAHPEISSQVIVPVLPRQPASPAPAKVVRKPKPKRTSSHATPTPRVIQSRKPTLTKPHTPKAHGPSKWKREWDTKTWPRRPAVISPTPTQPWGTKEIREWEARERAKHPPKGSFIQRSDAHDYETLPYDPQPQPAAPR